MAQSDRSQWFYAYLPQGISGGATSTLIPLFAYALGGSLVDVGIIAAATSVASVPAFVLWGGLSDRLGKRKVFLLLGFFGAALALLAMSASRSMSDFYLANLLAGFLGAAAGPAGTVLLVETSKRTEWPSKLALLGRITALGWVVGLSLGVAWLAIVPRLTGGDLASMRSLFVVGAALGLVAGGLVQLWTRDPAVRVNRDTVSIIDVNPRVDRGRYLPLRLLHFLRPSDSSLGRLPRSLRVYLLCVFLMFAGFTAFYSFFPIFLTQAYGLGGPEVFIVYIASHACSIAVYPQVGGWVSGRGGRAMQIYGSVGRSMLFGSFFLIGIPALPYVPRFAAALALHAGVGAFWAVINVAGSTLVSRLAPEEARARALGAFNAVQGFGSIFGPLAGGFAAGFLGYGPAFATSMALVLAGCALLPLARISDA